MLARAYKHVHHTHSHTYKGRIFLFDMKFSGNRRSAMHRIISSLKVSDDDDDDNDVDIVVNTHNVSIQPYVQPMIECSIIYVYKCTGAQQTHHITPKTSVFDSFVARFIVFSEMAYIRLLECVLFCFFCCSRQSACAVVFLKCM